MSTHRAAVKPSQEDAFTIKDLPSPRATPESVVVKVLATSIVPFMKEVMDGGRGYPIAYPIVPGALAIARLVEVGSDAVSLSPDQLCFCDITIRGRDDPNVSILMGLHGGAFGAPHMKLMEGEWHHGTYSQLAKSPLENVLPLDEDILIKQKGYTFEDLCHLGACMVPFGGLSDIGVKPGEHVIVAPATGKFGGAAVSAAIALGAVVIAAGRNEGVLGRLKAAYDDTGRFKSVTLSGQLDKDNAALLAATPQGMGADAYIDFSPPAAAKSTHCRSDERDESFRARGAHGWHCIRHFNLIPDCDVQEPETLRQTDV